MCERERGTGGRDTEKKGEEKQRGEIYCSIISLRSKSRSQSSGMKNLFWFFSLFICFITATDAAQQPKIYHCCYPRQHSSEMVQCKYNGQAELHSFIYLLPLLFQIVHLPWIHQFLVKKFFDAPKQNISPAMLVLRTRVYSYGNRGWFSLGLLVEAIIVQCS